MKRKHAGCLLAIAVSMRAASVAGSYSTPNTGVSWTMDDLVAQSSGAVTGAGTNYFMHEDVFVEPQDTLTIAAGTVITRDDGGTWPHLVIQGALVASGTSAQPILFTSGAARGSTNDFDRCLEFHDTAGPGSAVEWVVMENADIGFAAFGATNLTLLRCTTRHCNRGLYLQDAETQLSLCTIVDNDGGLWGTGVRVQGGEVRVNSCLISNNTAGTTSGYDAGGGIGAQQSDYFSLYNCVVVNNRAQFGGGVMAHECDVVRISRCTIADNEIIDESLDWNGPDIQLESCPSVILRRSTRLGYVFFYQSGGRVDNNRFSSAASHLGMNGCSPRVLHNLFDGGGWMNISCWNGASPEIVDNIFGAGWSIQERAANADPQVITNVWEGTAQYLDDNSTWLYGADELNALTGNSGNVETDPKLTSDGFGLEADSPCIDAGTPSGIAYDYYGEARPADGDGDGTALVDIGPFEFNEIACTFSADASSGLAPHSVIFSAMTVPTNSSLMWFEWDMDGDGTPDAQGTDLTVASNVYSLGAYTVSLTVTNAAAGSAQYTRTNYITAYPPARYTSYVSTAGSHQFPFLTWAAAATNLNAAVTQAWGAARFVVSNGTYLLSGQVDITNAVVMESVNGPTQTIIDANGPVTHGRALYIGHGDAVVDGFTIRNGETDDDGGGVFLHGGILRNCHVLQSVAEAGGGVKNDGGRVEGCTVSSNTCWGWPGGGGIYNVNGGTVAGSRIAFNHAQRGAGGIAYGLVTNCVIEGNHTDQDGGGAAGGELYACVLRGNTADNDGGGSIDSKCVGCMIVSNTAAYGGGYRADSLFTDHLQNCLIEGNRARVGGGVFVWMRVDMHNCSVAGNSATERGGGVSQGPSQSGDVRNTIIWGNCAPVGTNCYFYSGAGEAYTFCCTTPLIPGPGNIAANPMFADPASGDYRLLAASPCVDAGTSTNAPDHDLDGFARPVDGDGDGSARIDMGAYESQVVYEPGRLGNGRVSPETGATSTLFRFEVEYEDPVGAPRRAVAVVDGQDHAMSLAAGTTNNGTWRWESLLPSGQHSFLFEFEDAGGVAQRLPATNAFAGPYVGYPPALTNGAVSPANGVTATVFRFSVEYDDPEQEAPVEKSVFIDGQPFAMSPAGGMGTNAIYAYQTPLPPGAHSYHFEFEDPQGYAVRFPPAGELSGPSVDEPPRLWYGRVDPGLGATSTVFRFRVCYEDADDPPTQALLRVDGHHVPMTLVAGDATNGTYECETTLGSGMHSYRFEFVDAPGNACRWPDAWDDIGPRVVDAPLAYGGTVAPRAGDTNTVFRMGVRFADQGGAAPLSAELVVGGARYAMTPVGGSAVAREYECSTALPAGRHSHHFEFTTAGGVTVRHPRLSELCGPAVGTNVLYVSPSGGALPPFASWATAATNIADALSAAGPDCVVLVTNGTYRIGEQLELTNEIAVVSVNGPLRTIVDGCHTTRCVYMNNASAVLDGFTVCNGYTQYGAGIMLADGKVWNCTIAGNSSGNGAVRMSGNEGVVARSDVVRNHASSVAGGAYVEYAGTIADCRFIENSAVDKGGGIFVKFSAQITGCSLTANSAHEGGALHRQVNCFSTAPSCLERCIVMGNTAHAGAGAFLGEPLPVRNCLFLANVAEQHGGGLYAQRHSGGQYVEQCTFASNRATAGGGLYTHPYDIIVRNCVLWGNAAEQGPNYISTAGVTFSYCCASPGPEGDGNMAWDPRFVAPSGGDYRLAWDSPCRDSGLQLTGIINDVDGSARPVDGNADGVAGYDMGAYEAGALSPAGVLTNLCVEPVLSSTSLVYRFAVDFQAHTGTNVSGRLYVDDQAHDLVLTSGQSTNGTYAHVRELPGGRHVFCAVFTNETGGFQRSPSEGLAEICVPTVDNPVVDPPQGNSAGSFTFSADYLHELGLAPTSAAVYIDGSPHTLALTNGAVADGTYAFSTNLQPGVYTHYFLFEDELGNLGRVPVNGSFAGPTSLHPYHYVSLDGAHETPFDTWEKAATNVQAAIDATPDAGTVFVSNGLYLLTEPVAVHRTVTVESLSGAAETIVDGCHTTRCFTLTGGAVLDGFTVRHGLGGVYASTGTVRNCTVVSNAKSFAGGVQLERFGLLENSTVAFNTASYAGGVGVGVWARVHGCDVVSNRAVRAGGMMLYWCSTAETCRVAYNVAEQDGGGVVMDAFFNMLSDSRIEHNIAGTCCGGVRVGSGSGSLIRNSLLAFNSAGDRYGAVGLANDHSMALESCTVVSNSAGTDYGGIGNVSAVNSIVFFNEAPVHSNHWQSSLIHSCTEPLPSGEGNIDTPPQFAPGPPGAFRLAASSPCIDAGTNLSWMLDAQDLEGRARILDGTVDMGAFECAYRTIAATAGVHGAVAPSGTVHTLYGDDRSFAVQADPHWHIAAVLADGEPSGIGTQQSSVAEYTFLNVVTGHTLQCEFAIDTHTLTVVSEHGTAFPPPGTTTNAYGSLLTNMVSAVELAWPTQHVCEGWAMTGSAPLAGATNCMVMTLTNDAVLTWAWRTNYWLGAAAGAHGVVTGGNTWVAAGGTREVRAVPDSYYRFDGWTGTVSATTNPLRVCMTGPHSVTGTFAELLTTNDTPIWWLASFGLTNGDWAVPAGADQDGDGMLTWQEWTADTVPTDALSVLRLTGCLLTNGGTRVEWQGGVSACQYLERCEQLPGTQAAWIVVFTNLPPTAIRSNRFVDTPPEGARFYRLKAERP